MPTYIVSIRETLNLQVEVEADSEEEAKAEAIEAVVQEGSDRYFVNVEDRSVHMTLEKAP
jgi:hypothetical protein